MPLNLTISERIERRSIKVRHGRWACVESTYAPNSQGYPHMSIDGQFVYVHRASYEEEKGPIPEGMTIDHRCKNRRCRKVAHLEVVTRGVNNLRGNSPAARNARLTVCQKGLHPLEGDNLLMSRGKRYCRACRIERRRRTSQR